MVVPRCFPITRLRTPPATTAGSRHALNRLAAGPAGASPDPAGYPRTGPASQSPERAPVGRCARALRGYATLRSRARMERVTGTAEVALRPPDTAVQRGGHATRPRDRVPAQSRVAQSAERPAVNRQVIGSSPIAGASSTASDLHECMNRDGVLAGLTGFRLWGLWGSWSVGRDSGLHRLSGVRVRIVSQSGGSTGQRSPRRHEWPGRCRDGFTPQRTVVLTWRLRGATVVQASVSGCIVRTCRAVPGRSFGQGRRATRPWAGHLEVAEVRRSAEHGARIAGPGTGHARAQRVRLAAVAGPGCNACCRAGP